MWEMFDTDFDCGTECGGPGPPPKFLLPPPPRPPFMQDLNTQCSEDPIHDGDVCDAIPYSDPSYQSSPLLQTSALIALCSVALVLIVLISGLVIWKLKRKVQNFFPCKTPTRGGHLDHNGLPHSGQLAATYEDPDAHMGHSPLVLGHPQFQHRNHRNLELLHSKAIHYPSGFPMARSPPLFISSSPGPDPYRSHDNVYEELGPPTGPVRCESDAAESEHASHSEDEFAEDELSLAGECSFQKSQNQANNAAGTSSSAANQQQQQQQQHPGSSSLDTTTASTSSSTATTNTLPRSGQSPPLQQQQQTVSTIYKEYPPLAASNYIDGLIVEDNNNLINQTRMNERNPLLMMSGGQQQQQQQQHPFGHHHHHHPQQQQQPGSTSYGHYPNHPHHYPTVVGMSMTTGRPGAAGSSCCGSSATSSRSGSGSAAGRSLNRLMNPGSLFRGRKIHNGRGGAKANKNSGNMTVGSSSTTEPSCMSMSNVYYDPNQRTTDRVNNNLLMMNGHHHPHNNAGNEFMLMSNDGASPHVEDEVERRNRINRELNSMHHHTNGGNASANNNSNSSCNNNISNVATIFRERNGGCCPSAAVGVTPATGSAVYYPNNGSNNNGRRSANCRSLDRRRGCNVPGKPLQRGPAIIPNYSAPPAPAAASGGLSQQASSSVLDNGNFYADYTEPYQHMMFDANHNSNNNQRTGGGGGGGGHSHSQDFLRDSSFGSDSGYSQNTQISHRSGGPMMGPGINGSHHGIGGGAVGGGSGGTNNNHGGSWFRSSRRNVS